MVAAILSVATSSPCHRFSVRESLFCAANPAPPGNRSQWAPSDI